MANPHTPEPWDTHEMSGDVEVFAGPAKEKSRGILSGFRAMICRLDWQNSLTQRRADARRIVVCVNAMAGRSNAEVKALPKQHAQVVAALRDLEHLVSDYVRAGCEDLEGAAPIAQARKALAAVGEAPNG